MQVLITGASGGLGGAVVDAFLSTGASVVGVGTSPPPPRTGNFRSLAANLATREGCEFAVSAAGTVDVLVHLVGGFSGGETIENSSDEEWDRMMTLNLRSALGMFRAVAPGMRARRRGRIIAIGSRAGVEPAPHIAAYGASKAALIHLVRSLAAEVKSAGITANVVLPSTIDTLTNRAASPGADFSAWVKPEAIASLLVWLASEQAAAVNGAVIPIYGRA